MRNVSLLLAAILVVAAPASSYAQDNKTVVSTPVKTKRSTEPSGAPAKTVATKKVKATSSRDGASTASALPVRPSHVITRVNTDQKVVALTYDDGPNPAYTPKFVNLLKSNGVRATFFMCGNMIASRPDLAKMVYDNGFEIANHSYSHPFLPKKGEADVRSELTRTNQLLSTAAGGNIITLMRPPYGARNATVDQVCDTLGLKIILWDVDTNDWKKRSAESIAQTVLSQTRPGSIVLFHDRLPGTFDAQQRIIDGLKAAGYKFVTVSELLAMRK